MRTYRLICSIFLVAGTSLLACGGDDTDTSGTDGGNDGSAPDATFDGGPIRVADGGARADARPEDGSDSGPETGADATLDGRSDSGPETGADASDAADAVPVDGATDGEADAADSADSAVAMPLDPCAVAGPILVADGGAGPSRAWCHSFTYPAPMAAVAGVDPIFNIHVGFAPDGTPTLFGTARDPATIASTAIAAGEPFAVRFDGSGNPTSALAMAEGTYPDASYAVPNVLTGALGTSGAFAFGGDVAGTYGFQPGFFWLYDGSGAPQATETFLSAPPWNAQTAVAAIAPLAGGDFVVAGWAGAGTDFGNGALPTPYVNGSLYVARFTPAGACVWETALGQDNEIYERLLQGVASDAAGNVWVQTTGRAPDAGRQDVVFTSRFNGATGSPTGGTEIDPPAGTSPLNWLLELTPATGSGSGLTMAMQMNGHESLVWLNASDDGGVTTSRGPVLGAFPTLVTTLVSDGAGGALLTGMTQGGDFGAITLPTTPTAQCFVAHTDPGGNVTWATYCSALPYSAGTGLAVSGKTLLIAGTAAAPLPMTTNAFGSTMPVSLSNDAGPPPGTPAQVFVEELVLP
jgi:hypothetical protein